MFIRRGLILSVLVLGVLITMAPGVAFAIGIVGVIEPPPAPMVGCEDSPNDAARVGTVNTDFGRVAAVPIYVGSSSCINTFRFEFVVPTGLNFDHVEGNSWTLGFDTPAFVWRPSGDRHLIIARSGSNINDNPPCITPNGGSPFITLYFTSCGGTEHGIGKTITWVPNSTDEGVTPVNRLGVRNGCHEDPINIMTDGMVYINQVSIGFMGQQVSLAIDADTIVGVRCVNNYDFSWFTETLQWDQTIMELVDPLNPFGPQVARTGTTLAASGAGPGTITISGTKGDGYGLSANAGEEFYSLRFRIKAPHDGMAGYLTAAAGTVHATGMICGVSLDPLASAVWGGSGYVEVPFYSATARLGNVSWSNQTPLDQSFEVPVILDNNFPLCQFSLTVRYLTETRPVAPSVPAVTLLIPGLELGPNGGYHDATGYYFKFDVTGTIDRSRAGGQEIAKLRFHNSANTNQNWNNAIILADVPDQNYLNYVGTRAWLNESGNPRLQKLYLNGTTEPLIDPLLPPPPAARLGYLQGTLMVGDPLANSAVGSGSAQCRKIHVVPVCDNWAYSGFDARSNVDLDSVKFRVAWNTGEFCTQLQNLPSNVTIIDSSNIGVYRVKISGMAASADWHRYGTIKVFNNRGDEHTGTIGITPDGAWSFFTHGIINSSAAPGGIFVGPGYSSACAVSIPTYDKVATVPERFELIQNYPNPFNASTVINFDLAEPGQTTLEIYNIMGQLVATPFNSYTEAGRYSIRWEARDDRGQTVATGVYLYRLQSGAMTATKKMILLK